MGVILCANGFARFVSGQGKVLFLLFANLEKNCRFHRNSELNYFREFIKHCKKLVSACLKFQKCIKYKPKIICLKPLLTSKYVVRSTLITYKHFFPSLSAYMLQASLTADTTNKKINNATFQCCLILDHLYFLEVLINSVFSNVLI